MLDLADVLAVRQSKQELWRNQIKDLEKYLEVSEKPEDDLIAVQDARFSGSCEWFSTRKSYLKWKDFSPDAPSIFWLNGKPATGKSVLAGYVIDQLEATNADYSYFFFKYGDKSKLRLSACLRSMAFQMALENVRVREKLLEMHKDDVRFDKDDQSAIWRKVFLSGIFQTVFLKHYWVIDALDECVNFASLFAPMLAKLHNLVPLRILITSRESSELEKQFLSLGVDRFHSEKISTADTLPDIKLLVETKAESLGVKDDEDRAALVGKIVGKSNGSFLWTILVLKELSSADDEEEINQVLDDVPRDMEPLYLRTLELMSQATGGKKLANAVLAWSTCAVIPLTTEELDGALKLDVKRNFPNLEESIAARCGQLVYVDKFDKVQMVHETAREFLLSDGLKSEFAVKKSDAHTRIARTCLTYLTGEEMRPPRTRRRSSATSNMVKRSAFSVYACESFSEHLVQSNPSANDVLALLDQFLKSNVLSWIQVIALTQNLIPLIRTAKNLRTYLNVCDAERSSFGREMQTIRGWTTDLIRVAAKFGDALLTSPSAIYWLVLPFCPTESTVYKTANTGHGLSVAGLSNVQWDDRLSCIDFHEGKTTAVCHGDEFFAVGLNTGVVALYHGISCQEYKVLDHGEAVKLLQFECKTDLMASCGLKTIRVWNIRSGEIIHSFQAPQRTKCLAFDRNLLVAASYGCYLASWSLEDGSQRPDRPWYDSEKHVNVPSRCSPCAISISLEHKMLAVAYRGRPITLWDLEVDTHYGSCGKKLSNGATGPYMVNALLFNPNPAVDLLAAVYSDGDLVLLDPFGDRTLERFRADSHVLAASPDGRILVGADGFGTIHIYEFETLKLLYRIKSTACNIKQLAFSKDNLHFLDIRGSQCNVWEPPVLVRDRVGDDSSEGTPESATVVERIVSNYTIKITAIVLHPKGEFAFCGKEDGSVALYELHTGKQVRILYHHRSQCLVRILVWWPEIDILMSVDASNTIFAWTITKSEAGVWVAVSEVLRSRLDCGKSVIQVLAGHGSGKFILSTRESDHLWSIDGQEEMARMYSTKAGIRKWIEHPQSPFHMICVEGAVARIYAWSDWAEVTSVSLGIDPMELQPKSAISCMSGHRILIELSEQDGSQKTRALYLVDSSSFKPDSASKDTVSIPISEYASLDRRVSHVIGISEERLIFLDLNSWVCSVDLEGLSGSYLRHFFVPYDWFPSTRDLVCAVTADECERCVVFACNDDVAVVKRGLESAEKVEVVEPQSFPSVLPATEEVEDGDSVEKLKGKMKESTLFC